MLFAHPASPRRSLFPHSIARMLAAAFLLSPALLRADWTLTTGDFVSHPKVTVNEWTLAEQGGAFSYTDLDGKLNRLETRQVASLASDRAVTPRAAAWTLLLRNGDNLLGDPLVLKGETLSFKTADATLDIPLKLVASLRSRAKPATSAPTPTRSATPSSVRVNSGLGENAASPPPAAVFVPPAPPSAEDKASSDKDILRFKSGDLLQGLLVALGDGGVKMHSDLGDTDVKLENIDRLVFAGVTPARTLPSLSARITFLSGSILTTRNFKWTLADVTFTDPSGATRSCPSDRIASIQVLGGRIVWLTEIDPSKEEHATLLGTQWPLQINRNVTGGPLKVARQTFERGLGVHTRSVLTYDLDGSFTTLSLRAGLDDSAAPYGQAKLSILMDGKTLWQTTMKAGQITEPLKLTITDGHRLELHAEPAETLDVLGRVDWLDAVLLRP